MKMRSGAAIGTHPCRCHSTRQESADAGFGLAAWGKLRVRKPDEIGPIMSNAQTALGRGGRMLRRALVPGALAFALAVPALAAAHAERPTASPPRPAITVDQNRTPVAVLNVCKTLLADGTPECPYRHIQDAVNAIPSFRGPDTGQDTPLPP